MAINDFADGDYEIIVNEPEEEDEKEQPAAGEAETE